MIAFWLMTWWMCFGRRCGLTMVDYRTYVLIFVLMSVRCLLFICAKKERNDRSLTVDFVSVFRPSTPLMRCLCVMTVCVFDDIQWYSMIFNGIQIIFNYSMLLAILVINHSYMVVSIVLMIHIFV